MSGKSHKVLRNDRSMSNNLRSSHWLAKVARFDFCRGIHGAARARKGIKHGASTQRRRLGKLVIQRELDMMEDWDE